MEPALLIYEGIFIMSELALSPFGLLWKLGPFWALDHIAWAMVNKCPQTGAWLQSDQANHFVCFGGYAGLI